MALLSTASLNSRFAQLAVVTAFLLGILWVFTPSVAWYRPTPGLIGSNTEAQEEHSDLATDQYDSQPIDDSVISIQPQTSNHPIDHLIRKANEKLASLLATESKTLQSAAQAYRDRRGRQPPPNFDLWFAYAQNHSALLVEEFFDPIYDNLSPFWGVPAKTMREQTHDYLFRISIRNGNATQHSDGDRVWLNLWHDMIQGVAPYLPDMDIPVNEMDESRIVAPWEEITELVAKERASREVIAPSMLKTTFRNLTELDMNPPEKFNPEFNNIGPYWPMAAIGCSPESPARWVKVETDYQQPPPLDDRYPPGSYEGYVQNWTFAMAPCEHPAIPGIHGTFVEPISIANTRKLFPLFGGSKLPMNNEILLPPPMYWTDDPFYSGGTGHGHEWRDKQDKMIWRGGASGGRNRDNNWTRFQRHRFISAVNATSVGAAESSNQIPINFRLPQKGLYNLTARSDESVQGSLAEWIGTWSDVATVNLQCFPGEPDNKRCSYTDPYFDPAPPMDMQTQYNYKYLPDIDGNSFSGRYRGFLGSTSMPIKATIYQEWHDSRLVPWTHFVPMDNTFIDIYGIMEYFVGNKKTGVQGHDAVAKEIALGGKAWAEQVLRKEDMAIYVFRLLLEYGRLLDDDRVAMGWRES